MIMSHVLLLRLSQPSLTHQKWRSQPAARLIVDVWFCFSTHIISRSYSLPVIMSHWPPIADYAASMAGPSRHMANPERTPTPPLVEIGGLAGESDESSDTDAEDGDGAADESNSSGSDISDSDSDIDTASEAGPPSSVDSGGSGDDYAPEGVNLPKVRKGRARGQGRRRGAKQATGAGAKGAAAVKPTRRKGKVGRPVKKPAKGGESGQGKRKGRKRDEDVEEDPGDTVFE